LCGEAHLLQDVQVSLDLPLAAPQPLCHFVGGDAETTSLQRLQQPPLPE